MKIAIAIIVSLLLTNYSSGQNKFKALKWLDDIHLSIGPGITSFNTQQNSSFVNDDTRRTKIGFVGSIGLLHNFNSKWSINFKLMLESKGLKTQEMISTPNRDDPRSLVTGTFVFKTKLSYVSIAPVLRYHIGNTNIFVEGGPYLSYLLSGVYDTETSFSDPSYNYHVLFNAQNDNAFTQLDFGASVSVGYRIKLKKSNGITFQVMDNVGLTDIINKSGPHNTSKNTAASFLIGFTFKNKHNTS